MPASRSRHARVARAALALGVLALVFGVGLALGALRHSTTTSAAANTAAGKASSQKRVTARIVPAKIVRSSADGRLAVVPVLSADQTGGDPGDISLTVSGTAAPTGQVDQVRYVKSYLSGSSVLDRTHVLHEMLYGNAVIVLEYHVSPPPSRHHGHPRANPGPPAFTGAPVLGLLGSGLLLLVGGTVLLLLARRRDDEGEDRADAPVATPSTGIVTA